MTMEKIEYKGFVIEAGPSGHRLHADALANTDTDEVGKSIFREMAEYHRNGILCDIRSGWKSEREREIIGDMLDGTCSNGVHFDNCHEWHMHPGKQPDGDECVEIVKYVIDSFLAKRQLFPIPPKFQLNVMTLLGVHKWGERFWCAAAGIRLANLAPEDVGEKVVYTPPVGLPERGVISSWNDKFVFVRYEKSGFSHPVATDPKDLKFDL